MAFEISTESTVQLPESATNEEELLLAKTKNPGETPPNPLSKNQIKKQKKLKLYETLKKERRIKEREKLKVRRQEAAAKGLPVRTGPSRKELKKRTKASIENPNALNVAIDLDYDDLMHDGDVAKCIKQCLRIYTINRRSHNPCRLHFTGIKENGRIHNILKKNDGWQNWNVDYHFNKTHIDIFAKNQIVYLTCESDTVLEKLDAECIYVIGGLVDHNHQKGLCHERAVKADLKTARLPLSEYVDMKTRSVLSTFHVFELLVGVYEGKSWTDAILETIPLRKGAKPKKSKDLNCTDGDSDSKVDQLPR
ncbi:tRNA methyltransferase 10 homolog A [Teleopsis dalmanni]|uniref:tRNA methyltransferase 10 homolog A n=1 Tax=Teleopsis dalmanni TaxID=139649 RepID=UPI0018CF8B05|nr:tRNA methyltransferase 10 homolog A [Teleopsis dalmanni]